jgi:hypothetical protein
VFNRGVTLSQQTFARSRQDWATHELDWDPADEVALSALVEEGWHKPWPRTTSLLILGTCDILLARLIDIELGSFQRPEYGLLLQQNASQLVSRSSPF